MIAYFPTVTEPIWYSGKGVFVPNPQVQELAGPRASDLPKGEAWIVPVFGRGRALGAWPASLMDEEGFDEVCHFLTGACSCQVKQQNPGWDLIMNIDWDDRLLAIAEGEPIELTETPSSPEQTDETAETDTVEITPKPKTSDINLTPILVAGILLIGGFLLLRRK